MEPYSTVVELSDPTGTRQADVIVLDVFDLPEGGVPAARAAVSGGQPVLVLTGEADERLLLRMLRVGVRGFVRRPVEPSRLASHLASLAAGEVVIDHLTAVRASVLAARFLDLDRPPAELLGLSPREVQVLARLDTGGTAREIGAEMFVSHETVRSHLKRIYRKLGVHDRTEALARAHQEGILPVG